MISFSKKPALVTAHGCVTLLDDTRKFFILTPAQYVTGATQHEVMPVRAIMDKNPTFLSPAYHLPRNNTVVAITGTLDVVEHTSEPESVTTVRAAVSVGTISHLSGEDDMLAPKEDEDTVALKTRVQKYVANPQMEDEETHTSEKESSSLSSKGKRKLTLTLDRCSSGKVERGEKKKR